MLSKGQGVGSRGLEKQLFFIPIIGLFEICILQLFSVTVIFNLLSSHPVEMLTIGSCCPQPVTSGDGIESFANIFTKIDDICSWIIVKFFVVRWIYIDCMRHSGSLRQDGIHVTMNT